MFTEWLFEDENGKTMRMRDHQINKNKHDFQLELKCFLLVSGSAVISSFYDGFWFWFGSETFMVKWNYIWYKVNAF